MKALSIRQPWANLIMLTGKDIENRGWYTPFRGRVWIHVGKAMTEQEWQEAFYFAEIEGGIAEDALFEPLDFDNQGKNLPRGGIIGTVEIVDCVRESDSPWFVGPYGFVLKDPEPCDFIPCKGRLGFFDPEVSL